MQGRKVGVILCGGNIDTEWFLAVLGGGIPEALSGVPSGTSCKALVWRNLNVNAILTEAD